MNKLQIFVIVGIVFAFFMGCAQQTPEEVITQSIPEAEKLTEKVSDVAALNVSANVTASNLSKYIPKYNDSADQELDAITETLKKKTS